MNLHRRSSASSLDTKPPIRRSSTPPPPRAKVDDRALPRWRRITRKILIGIAIAVVALWALWVIVGNIALRTRFLRSKFNQFPKHTIEYSSAWTVWPGVIHARDLHLRVRDYGDEILLVIDDGWVQIDLFGLAHKQFIVSDAEVHGVSLRFRERLDPRIPHPKTYALPPIEGFDAVPWMDLSAWEPPKDDAHYDLLTIDVRNVRGDVREIWMQDYHFTGKAEARGSFYLKPGKQLEIGPAHFASTEGEVRVGDDVAFVGTGAIDVKMPRFDLTEWQNAEMLNAMAMADARLDGRIPSWAFLEHRHLGMNPPHLEGGAATLHLDAHVRAGELWTGTKITLDVNALTVQSPKVTVSGSIATTVEVNEVKGAREMSVHASLSSAEVKLKGAQSFPLRAPTIGVFARSSNLALRKPFNDLKLSIDAPDVMLTDLRIFQEILPPKTPMRIGMGAATAKVHLDAEPASGFGEATLSLTTHTASLQANDAKIAATIGVEVKAARLNLSTGDADLSHSWVDLRDVVYQKGDDKAAPWWGRVDFDAATLRPKSKQTKLALAASIRMRDVRPILATYAAVKGMPGWLREILAMEDFRGVLRARVGEGVDIDDFRATSTDVSVGAKVHKHQSHTQGAVMVDWKGVNVGIELGDDGAKPILMHVRDWFDSAK